MANDIESYIDYDNEFGSELTLTLLPNGTGQSMLDIVSGDEVILIDSNGGGLSIVDLGDGTVRQSAESSGNDSRVDWQQGLQYHAFPLESIDSAKDLVYFVKLQRGSSGLNNNLFRFLGSNPNTTPSILINSASNNEGISVEVDDFGTLDYSDINNSFVGNQTHELLIHYSKTGQFTLYDCNGVGLIDRVQVGTVSNWANQKLSLGIGGSNDLFYGSYLIVSDTSFTDTQINNLAANPYQVFSTTENLMPIANAGANAVAIQGGTISLNGSNSSDPESQTLTYLWEVHTAPSSSAATITNATSQVASFIPDVVGTYYISLVVNDGSRNSAKDFKEINVLEVNLLPLPTQTNFLYFNGVDESIGLNQSVPTYDNFKVEYEFVLHEISLSQSNIISSKNPKNQAVSNDNIYYYVDGSDERIVINSPSSISYSFVYPISNGNTLVKEKERVTLSFVKDLNNLAISCYLNGVESTLNFFVGNQSGVNNILSFWVLANYSNDFERIDFFGYKIFDDIAGSNLTYHYNPNDPSTVLTAPTLHESIQGGTYTFPSSGTSFPTWMQTHYYYLQLNGIDESININNILVDSFTSVKLEIAHYQTVVDDELVIIYSDSNPDNKITFTITSTNQVITSYIDSVTQSFNFPLNTVDAGERFALLFVLDGSLIRCFINDTEANNTQLLTISGRWNDYQIIDGKIDFYKYQVRNATDQLVVDVDANSRSSDGSGILLYDDVRDESYGSNNADNFPRWKDAMFPNATPVADAGSNTSVTTGQAVTLDGSNSSDSDSDPLTYNWLISSKPNGSNATLSNSSAANPTFVPDLDGTYIIQLIVNDGKEDSYADTVFINSSTPNQIPIANAGADQFNIDAGSTVTLDGTASGDGDGTIINYQWTQIAGDAVSLNTSNLAQPTFTAPSTMADQTLTFSLVVTDNNGATSENLETVNIEVLAQGVQPMPTYQSSITNKTKPIASIELSDGEIIDFNDFDGGLSSVSNNITLTGYNSLLDAFTPNYSYLWRVINGTGTLSATDTAGISATGTALGAFELGLVVSELTDSSAEATSSVTIQEVPDNIEPTVNLVPNTLVYNLTVGDTFTLPTATLTDNRDATRTIAPTSNNVNTATEGSYSVVYSGYQDQAGNVADTVTITVNVAEELVNPSLVVTASINASSTVYVDSSFIATSSVSTNPAQNNPIYSYQWRVISGTAAINAPTASSTSITPTATGSLQIGLIATLNGTSSQEAIYNITVIEQNIVVDPNNATEIKRLDMSFLTSRIDTAYVSSDIYFDSPIDTSGKYGVSDNDDISNAVYIISDRRNNPVVIKQLGSGIEKLEDDKLRIFIDDADLTKKGVYRHQLVLYNSTGDKLPPEFLRTLVMLDILRVTND
jgi:hypothetical protein